jgi:aminopeptidase N
MLRYMLSVKTGGDEKFWEILRTFLKEFSGKSASTEDFIAVSQRVVGSDLGWFWSQWLLRTEIPKVRWTHHIESKDGKLLLTVEAEQLDTEFTLLIPVYVHFSGGKFASQPLVMKGRTGKVQMLLPQEPKDVTINDNWEALIDIAP